MIQFLLNHPSLLLFLVPSIPTVLGKIEKAAIARLLATGDAADQELLRSVARAVVLWAEKKGAQDGAAKFAAADRLVARALPFLSTDQRRALIEGAVAELDKDANAAVNDAGQPPH